MPAPDNPPAPEHIFEATLSAGEAEFSHSYTKVKKVHVVPQYVYEPLFTREDADAVATGTGIGGGGFTTVADGRITAIEASVGTVGSDVGTSVQFAFLDDGGSFTDDSADAKDAGAGDVPLLPATPAQNDAFYFGAPVRFKQIEMDVAGTNGVSATTDLKFEYWNGSAWASFSGLTDGTSGLTDLSAGKKISWSIPATWALKTVNSQSAYWFRIRENAGSPSWSTIPLVSQVNLGISAIIDVNIAGTSAFATAKKNAVLYDDESYAFVPLSDLDNSVFADAISITVDVDYVALGTAPQDLKVKVYGFLSEGNASTEPEKFSVTFSELRRKGVVTSNNALSNATVDIYVQGI